MTAENQVKAVESAEETPIDVKDFWDFETHDEIESKEYFTKELKSSENMILNKFKQKIQADINAVDPETLAQSTDIKGNSVLFNNMTIGLIPVFEGLYKNKKILTDYASEPFEKIQDDSGIKDTLVITNLKNILAITDLSKNHADGTIGDIIQKNWKPLLEKYNNLFKEIEKTQNNNNNLSDSENNPSSSAQIEKASTIAASGASAILGAKLAQKMGGGTLSQIAMAVTAGIIGKGTYEKFGNNREGGVIDNIIIDGKSAFEVAKGGVNSLADFWTDSSKPGSEKILTTLLGVGGILGSIWVAKKAINGDLFSGMGSSNESGGKSSWWKWIFGAGGILALFGLSKSLPDWMKGAFKIPDALVNPIDTAAKYWKDTRNSLEKNYVIDNKDKIKFIKNLEKLKNNNINIKPFISHIDKILEQTKGQDNFVLASQDFSILALIAHENNIEFTHSKDLNNFYSLNFGNKIIFSHLPENPVSFDKELETDNDLNITKRIITINSLQGFQNELNKYKNSNPNYSDKIKEIKALIDNIIKKINTKGIESFTSKNVNNLNRKLEDIGGKIYINNESAVIATLGTKEIVIAVDPKVSNKEFSKNQEIMNLTYFQAALKGVDDLWTDVAIETIDGIQTWAKKDGAVEKLLRKYKTKPFNKENSIAGVLLDSPLFWTDLTQAIIEDADGDIGMIVGQTGLMLILGGKAITFKAGASIIDSISSAWNNKDKSFTASLAAGGSVAIGGSIINKIDGIASKSILTLPVRTVTLPLSTMTNKIPKFIVKTGWKLMKNTPHIIGGANRAKHIIQHANLYGGKLKKNISGKVASSWHIHPSVLRVHKIEQEILSIHRDIAFYSAKSPNGKFLYHGIYGAHNEIKKLNDKLSSTKLIEKVESMKRDLSDRLNRNEGSIRRFFNSTPGEQYKKYLTMKPKELIKYLKKDSSVQNIYKSRKGKVSEKTNSNVNAKKKEAQQVVNGEKKEKINERVKKLSEKFSKRMGLPIKDVSKLAGTIAKTAGVGFLAYTFYEMANAKDPYVLLAQNTAISGVLMGIGAAATAVSGGNVIVGGLSAAIAGIGFMVFGKTQFESAMNFIKENIEDLEDLSDEYLGGEWTYAGQKGLSDNIINQAFDGVKDTIENATGWFKGSDAYEYFSDTIITNGYKAGLSRDSDNIRSLLRNGNKIPEWNTYVQLELIPDTELEYHNILTENSKKIKEIDIELNKYIAINIDLQQRYREKLIYIYKEKSQSIIKKIQNLYEEKENLKNKIERAKFEKNNAKTQIINTQWYSYQIDDIETLGEHLNLWGNEKSPHQSVKIGSRHYYSSIEELIIKLRVLLNIGKYDLLSKKIGKKKEIIDDFLKKIYKEKQTPKIIKNNIYMLFSGDGKIEKYRNNRE